MSKKKHVDQLLVWHVEQLGEVVCLIAISEKVDTKKLIREAGPDLAGGGPGAQP